MSLLLLIETSTKVCSAALSREGEVIGVAEEKSSSYSHSSQLTVFIKKLIDEAGISFEQLDGVSVSKGPGSYTGLRIGVSVAKGLCYALDIPLISVDTLKAMAVMVVRSRKDILQDNKDVLLCPMIDARRMEVYNAIFDYDLNVVKSVTADVVDSNTFSELLKNNTIWFFGDGAAKCSSVIDSPNVYFLEEIEPSAIGMAPLAYEKFMNNNFESTAYFEPFYLKDFIGGKPKVKGLFD